MFISRKFSHVNFTIPGNETIKVHLGYFKVTYWTYGPPIGRYFCTAEITCQKKWYFPYPSNQTLLFHSGNKIVSDKNWTSY